MQFAIRDDDTSFFTRIEELESAYDFLEEDECVSLSVVPFSVPIHRDDVFPYGKCENTEKKHIEDNVELVDYLREQVQQGKYDILLHGYSHEYKKVADKWVAEMKWKSESQLFEELPFGKKILENLLNCNISVFVAPNNSIDQKAIDVIEELNMDYSGIILKGDRKKTLRYCINFIKRWIYRMFVHIPYPGILNYGKHKELVAYTLDDYDRLIKEYNKCKKHKSPFVVYTHYWQLNGDAKQKELIKKVYKYIKEDGAKLVSVSDCFGR